MKTKYYFLAALATAVFASCTSDEYVGDVSAPALTSQGTSGAIAFGSNAGNPTRATSNTGTVARMLDHQFKVYGVKNVSGYTDVFKNYLVWDATTKTTSNPDGADVDADNTARMNGWEYVGPAGTYGVGTGVGGDDGTGVAIANAQTIKYWDYSATDYHFVAGSPYGNFTFNTPGSGIGTATVTGIAGHVVRNSGTPGTTVYNPVYIADPVKVEPADYQKEVVFNFTRQQSFVRVGVFETIPGYSISEIHFYEYNTGTPGWKATAETNQNIILACTTADYFQGASNATATLTYNWSTLKYTSEYTTGVALKNNWYAGELSGVPAKTSTHATASEFYGTDADMATTGYFTVLPTPSEATAQALLVKCDYTLTNDDGNGETIKVTGATAAIPAAFSKWNPNTTYTYLFKISDNTNGTTGTVGSDPEGLYPITFDAAVIAEEDAMKQGYITTVSTPSITTYQEGSVKAAGIQYTVAQGAIYFTAQDDETGELKTLAASNYGSPATGQVQVYKVAAGTTEADLILTRPAEGNKFATGGGGSAWSINGQSVPAAKWASFTPDVAGTYAIEYATSASSFAYKIVVVE